MAERRLFGRSASPGFAKGKLVAAPPAQPPARVASGDPDTEEAALRAAVAQALADIAALAQATPSDGADVLSFQLALLSDEELYRGALAAIAEGRGAQEAWHEALTAEIAGYADSQDEYFRARSADLADIRDRVARQLAGSGGADGLPEGVLVVAEDLAPSRFLATDWTKGGAILLAQGSPTSHVAMLARSRAVPMIVGLGDDILSAAGLAHIEADRGLVVIDPEPASAATFEERRSFEETLLAGAGAAAGGPAHTADGTRIGLWLNIADPAELDGLDPAICDGVGLVRTEFMFHAHGSLPDEETQYAAYRRVLAWADGRPVTIRTLDAGGDKPIQGLTIGGESNPFLGLRGIRLSLLRPEIFRVQLRALARAAAHGALKVMLPMVTVPAELEAARAMLAEEIAAARAMGVAVGEPALGIMVEVPAAALALDRFDVAFFSIGSNDLTHYATAAARDLGAVADLADPRHPGVLRLIAEITRHGRESGREVSICGDAAGDPALLPVLLAADLRILSMAPALVPRAKAAIARIDLRQRGRHE